MIRRMLLVMFCGLWVVGCEKIMEELNPPAAPAPAPAAVAKTVKPKVEKTAEAEAPPVEAPKVDPVAPAPPTPKFEIVIEKAEAKPDFQSGAALFEINFMLPHGRGNSAINLMVELKDQNGAILPQPETLNTDQGQWNYQIQNAGRNKKARFYYRVTSRDPSGADPDPTVFVDWTEFSY